MLKKPFKLFKKITSDKPSLKWAFAYWIVVFVFSVIYLISWAIRHDSFIVHRELNLTPVSDTYNVLWVDEKHDIKTFGGSSLDEMQKNFLEKYTLAKGLEDRVRQLGKELELGEENEENALKRLNDRRWKDIRSYREDKLSGLNSEKVEVSEALSLLEEKTSTTGNGIAIANQRVKLAKIELAIAELDFETRDYALNNLALFVSPEDKKKLVETQNNNQKVRSNLHEVEMQRGKLRGEMNHLLSAWHESRAEQIGWIDMLYYSIGISTTTTFGDIMANSRIVRALVSLQLILSLIIVGGFVNAVTND